MSRNILHYSLYPYSHHVIGQHLLTLTWMCIAWEKIYNYTVNVTVCQINRPVICFYLQQFRNVVPHSTTRALLQPLTVNSCHPVLLTGRFLAESKYTTSRADERPSLTRLRSARTLLNTWLDTRDRGRSLLRQTGLGEVSSLVIHVLIN